MKVNCPGEYLNSIADMGSHVLELSIEHEFMKTYMHSHQLYAVYI